MGVQTLPQKKEQISGEVQKFLDKMSQIRTRMN